MASPNQEEAVDDEMDVLRPRDADGMDELEQEEDIEGDDDETYEDGGSLSAQMHQFLTEMDLDLAQRRQTLKSLIKGGGGRHARGGGGLPRHLKAAMGQANLRVARGDLEEAIKICMEVVRQAPDVPEPFATLEMIYEEMGDEDKRFQFALIAAHLQPRDSQQWIKTAELAEQRGDLRVAVKCYTKAISITPSNVALLWKKASLLRTLTHTNKSLETYQKLIDVLPASSGQDYVAVSMEMAKIHHDAQNTVQAIKVLKSAYRRHFACVTEEAVNMLAELYMVTKDYWGALETILEYYNIPLTKEVVERGKEGDLPSIETFIPPVPPSDSTTPTSSSAAVPVSLSEAIGRSLNLVQSPPTEVTQPQFDGEKKEEDPVIKFVEELVIPPEVPLDLKTKIAVCLIHLYSTAPQYLLFSLYELDAEDYGDVFLDIAEAFMESELYARAQPLLSILVETQNYSQAGVWLKHAECLHSLNQLESAASSYAQVVALAPHHTNAKLTLATIYGQLGRTDDALAVLGGEGAVGDGWPEEPPLAHFPLMANLDQLPPSIQDLRVSYRRFDLLYYEERLTECSDLALEMLHFLFRDYIYHPNLKAMAHLTFKSVKRKVTEVEYQSEELKKDLQTKEKQLSWEEWWHVMEKGCQALWMLGRKDELCRVVFAANVSNWFGGITKEMDYELAALSFSACALSGDWKQAVLFLRTLISTDWPQSGSQKLHALWNYFNLGPLNLSIIKFLLRLLIKDQGSLPVLKMGANYYFCSGSFRTSLNLYHAVLKQDPTDHLAYFCMGLVFLTMAHQKGRVLQLPRSPLIAQAFAFLCHYAKLRGRCQETLYNLGRAFHQIGFVNYASHLYKQVLSTPPELADDPASDLKQEAAFNLALIYKNSQNRALARHILWTYIQV